jgi:CheY-like chemotaxis protein
LPEEAHIESRMPMAEAPLVTRSIPESSETGEHDESITVVARPRPRPREEAPRLAEQSALPGSVSSVLIVEHGNTIDTIVKDMVNGHPVTIRTLHSGKEAYEILQTTSFDCMILGMDFTDISGSELLEMLGEDGKQDDLPVLVYRPQRLHPDEEQRLRRQVKNRAIDMVMSPEYLRHRVANLLPSPKPQEEFHVPEEIINLVPEPEPEVVVLDEDVTRELQQVEELLLEQQQELRMFRSKDAVLNRRIILVVSRERGNVYTLMNVLQEKGAQVLFAENSRDVMQQLESRAEVDLVLIENVLPDKDGCEAIRMIRSQARYSKLPIIVLMVTTNPEDYQRCLDAGANDYLFKPVDTDELVSLLRVWLY